MSQFDNTTMKNFLLVIGFLIVFSGCGDKEKEIKDLENAIAAIDTGTSVATPKENTSRLFFKASGTEPGWSLEMYTDKLRLLLDYGKDSVIIADNFEEMAFEDDYKYSHFDSKIEINVMKGPCVHDGSGESLSKTVVINRETKTYKGCGEFVK